MSDGKIPGRRPASRDPARDHEHGHDPAEHVDHQLQAVVPGHAPQPAKHGVEDRDRPHRPHAPGERPARELLEHERREEQPQPVAEVARYEKQQRRRPLHERPEPVAEYFVGGIELAAEVEGQQEPDDREPAEHVAQRQLQKPHAGLPEALTRHAEHRGGTRFGGHDRP